VIVVSDPKADKAAAAMDVGVGHLSDPADLPGCAHFWYVAEKIKSVQS
jgi:insulysin